MRTLQMLSASAAGALAIVAAVACSLQPSGLFVPHPLDAGAVLADAIGGFDAPVVDAGDLGGDPDANAEADTGSELDAEPDDAGTDADAHAAVDAGTDGAVACTDPGALFWTDNGHCYFPITSSASFDSQESACAATGAHLVTINTDAENNEIQGFFNNSQDRWIGLRAPDAGWSDQTSFQWITGEALDFNGWPFIGEPFGSGTCADEYLQSWANGSCTASRQALCERE